MVFSEINTFLLTAFNENRPLVELVYALIIVLASGAIFHKFLKYYRLSSYRGFRYLGNAFLFFGLAFLLRFFWIEGQLFGYLVEGTVLYALFFLAFGYLVMIGGLYLVYSLIWKHFEKGSVTSPQCARLHAKIKATHIYYLHGFAVAIAVLDYFFSPERQYFMFLSQLTVIGYAWLMVFSNYKSQKDHKTGMQLYLIALTLAFVGFLANFLTDFIQPIFPVYIVYVYFITTMVFIDMLYAVIMVPKCQKNAKD